MGQRTKNGFELPEGTTILEREPAEHSVELAIDLARRGASMALVRAIGGEEAVDLVEEIENGDTGNGANGA
ncbi:MAG TPA: hypothetical protein VHG69_10130 [Thermoleophilaceae bacterium]|nr:hypothetical protein [Thermoleophilaceae bacterium]